MSGEMILGLETSCDETAIALFDPAEGLVGEWVHSQIIIHQQYGGVVPDLATREHLRAVAALFEQARGATEDFKKVTRIAVTHGPGLAGCLAIGTASAKALALGLGVGLIGVNHLRGHAFSPFISLHREAPDVFEEKLQALLPHLGLIVSGGNTLLFAMNKQREIKVISSTRDDAAGEAFDKGAKLLGLGYPGGPKVELEARKGRANAYDFPRGIGPRSELDFSFSGVKTSLRYLLEKMSPDQIASALPDLCASYQQAVIDALVRKSGLALEFSRYASIGLSGGVANNLKLRGAFAELAKRHRVKCLIALPEHTGDNAAMIAFAGWCDPSSLILTEGARAGLQIDPSLALDTI